MTTLLTDIDFKRYVEDRCVGAITDMTQKEEFMKKLITNIDKLITTGKYEKLKPLLEQLKKYLEEKLNWLNNTDDVNNMLNELLDSTTTN